jgi:hypothetical protein
MTRTGTKISQGFGLNNRSSSLQSRILAERKMRIARLERPLRYVRLLIWLLRFTLRTSRARTLLGIGLSVAARALIMGGFVVALRATTLVVSGAERQATLRHLHLPFLSEFLLVVLVAGFVAVLLLLSGLSAVARRRILEKLGNQLSMAVQQEMVQRFQLELQGETDSVERRRLYVQYSTRFENEVITAIKHATGNAVELLTGLVLTLITLVMLVFIDVGLAVFVAAVIVTHTTISVAFFYGEHWSSIERKQTKTVELTKVANLLDDFVDKDEGKRRAAREKFSGLKEGGLITADAEEPSAGISYARRVLRFIADPVNSMIVMSAPVFLFVIFYAYSLSLFEEVTIVRVVFMVFIARFSIQFAHAVTGEARKFSIRYRSLRLGHQVMAEGRPIIPMLALPAQPAPEKVDEPDDEQV